MIAHSKQILVAGFDRDTARLLRACIEDAGFAVILAMDGEMTWELIQAHAPALVLMEAALPGLSSSEIIRRVRRSDQYSELPVMILGDPCSTEEIVEWFKRGIDEYVSKPFLIQVLIARIRSIVRRVDRGREIAYHPNG